MHEQDTKMGLWVINGLIDVFRKNNFPVIRIYHTELEGGPHPDSSAFQFPDHIAIKDSDPKIITNYPSAFKKTDLEKILREKKCNTLFLCGLSSVGCVISTYFGAKDLDFNTYLVKDATFCHNADYTDNIETIFEAVGYDMVKLILENK